MSSYFLAEGIELFNAGRYFEAHEVWEDLWRETPSGEAKLYYQALIQAAVGLYHLHRGNRIGARSQLSKSIAKLRRYPEDWAGIGNAELLRDLEAQLELPLEKPLDAARVRIVSR